MAMEMAGNWPKPWPVSRESTVRRVAAAMSGPDDGWVPTEPPTDGIELRTFLDLYLEALVGGHAAVFVGAGLSVPAGYVNWRALLKPRAGDVGLAGDREEDRIRVTPYAI